jgi:ribosomal RNA small subunit methyltransferase D
MIYLISKYYEYRLVDFKEAGFDWLIKFENTFDETIKFIENTNKLEKPRFHRERIVSIKKEQKINLVLNSDLIDEKIKEKIKFCYNL